MLKLRNCWTSLLSPHKKWSLPCAVSLPINNSGGFWEAVCTWLNPLSYVTCSKEDQTLVILKMHPQQKPLAIAEAIMVSSPEALGPEELTERKKHAWKRKSLIWRCVCVCVCRDVLFTEHSFWCLCEEVRWCHVKQGVVPYFAVCLLVIFLSPKTLYLFVESGLTCKTSESAFIVQQEFADVGLIPTRNLWQPRSAESEREVAHFSSSHPWAFCWLSDDQWETCRGYLLS